MYAPPIVSPSSQVGRGVAIALLDMHQLNPWSRVPSSEHASLASVRQFLQERTQAARTKKDGARMTRRYVY